MVTLMDIVIILVVLIVIVVLLKFLLNVLAIAPIGFDYHNEANIISSLLPSPYN